MQSETRTVCFDTDLNIEAYSFKVLCKSFQIIFTNIMLLVLLKADSGIYHARIKNTSSKLAI